jgi:ABC-2 type transport system permease protein
VTAAVTPVARVRVPARSWRTEARAARVVVWRDLVRLRNDRVRIWTALVQPLLFLFVLAPGLESLARPATDGVALRTFMFPGVICMTVWFSAMISAAGLVMDRELGFLRELQIAPVGRVSIIAGKCLAGTIIATGQGALVLALAGLVGVPYDPVLLLGMLALQLAMGFSVAALGVMLATTITQAQRFNGVMQTLLFPMIFLSGAMYPVADLPPVLRIVNRLNPLTYAVDPMRRLVFDRLDVSDAARQVLAPGVTWWGWRLPVALELAIVVGVGAAMLGLAAARFSRMN